MAPNRETMTGRMKPITDADREAATRLGLLWAVALVTLAVAGHLSYELGVWLGETYVRL